MAWLLDGNNILGRLSPTPRTEGDREQLLHRLLRLRLPKPCTVVFDGPPPGPAVSPEFQMGGVRVVYAGGRSADDVILARVKPGDQVVTADRDLALRCRGRRARAQDPRSFMESLKPAVVPRGGSEKPSGDDVDVQEWLQFFGTEDGE